MSARDYDSTGVFPYLQASGGFGPLKLQDRGDVLSEAGTFQANASIASVSNTTPIVVTTTAAHYFSTGDQVHGYGSDVAAVNQPHTITVLTGTTFSLVGTTAGGAGTGVGIVTAIQRGTLGKLIDASRCFAGALGMVPNYVAGDPITVPVDATFTYGLTSNGNVVINDDLNVTGDVDVTSGLDVHGNAAVDGTLTVSTQLHVEGSAIVDVDVSVTGDVNVTGDVDVTSGLDVHGNAAVDGTLTVSTQLTVNGNETGTIADSSTRTRSGSLTRNGTTAYENLRKVTAPNSDTTIAGTAQDLLVLPASPGALRSYDLGNPSGKILRFVAARTIVGTSAHDVRVEWPVGTLIAVFPADTNKRQTGEFISDGTDWFLIGAIYNRS